jgi:hypothetical protein
VEAEDIRESMPCIGWQFDNVQNLSHFQDCRLPLN